MIIHCSYNLHDGTIAGLAWEGPEVMFATWWSTRVKQSANSIGVRYILGSQHKLKPPLVFPKWRSMRPVFLYLPHPVFMAMQQKRLLIILYQTNSTGLGAAAIGVDEVTECALLPLLTWFSASNQGFVSSTFQLVACKVATSIKDIGSWLCMSGAMFPVDLLTTVYERLLSSVAMVTYLWDFKHVPTVEWCTNHTSWSTADDQCCHEIMRFLACGHFSQW